MASAVDAAVIAVMGVFFLGMGMYALAAPAMLVRPFGITLEHPRRGRRYAPSTAVSAWPLQGCWRTRPLTADRIEAGS